MYDDVYENKTLLKTTVTLRNQFFLIENKVISMLFGGRSDCDQSRGYQRITLVSLTIWHQI